LYQIPDEEKPGPKSEPNEACIFLTWFAWHTPLLSMGMHAGATKVSADLFSATLKADSNATVKVFVCKLFDV
jgi:hypothetical protein